MGDARAAGDHPATVVGGEMGGVGEHRVLRQEPEPVERGGVGRPVPFEYVVVLPVALRAVGLDTGAGRRRQLAEPLEQGIGAGRDEPGGDDRLHEPGSAGEAADLVDRPGAGLHPEECVGVPVPGRCAGRMVHRHPADEGPLAVASTGRGQRGRRRLVDARVVHGGGGPGGEQRGHHRLPHVVGELRVGEAGLERERVVEEPFLQWAVEGGRELGPLRGVDVGVDQPGDEDLVRGQGHVGPVVGPGSGDGRDQPLVVHRDEQLGGGEGVGRRRLEDPGPDREGPAHANPTTSTWGTTKTAAGSAAHRRKSSAIARSSSSVTPRARAWVR